MKAGKKAEVAAMAESIKTAVNAFYAEYSSYPSNTTFKTDKNFLTLMTTTNTTGGNYRGLAFLEVPPKFTNSTLGICTPRGFYKGSAQSNFFILMDTGNVGYIRPKDASGSTVTNTNVPSSVAVWVIDRDTNTKAVGTFK